MGLVDWDHDGDLDAWISNRNSPQLRFMLNESPDQGQHIAVTLEGTTCNRDAIGARVELVVDGGKPLIRTLRAGEGFLAQSSKRILFGLGAASQVDQIIVNWPGGQRETFSCSPGTVGKQLHLVEGEGDRGAIAVESQARELTTLAQKPLPLPGVEPTFGSFCFSMVRLPLLDYETMSGSVNDLEFDKARLTLVTLWASWCQPCVVELHELVDRKEELRRRGIDVVALSIDRLTPDSSEEGADQRQLEALKFSFRHGRARAQDLDALQLLHDAIFELHTPLPIPTSFLIDRRGRTVAVYQGPVTVDRLLADANRLNVKTTAEWRAATLPWPGRWQMPPNRRHLFDYVMTLADRGYIRACRMYVENNQKMLTQHPNWPALYKKISATTSPN